MSADLVELVKTGKMSEMNTLSGCQYDYPEIVEYLKEADIISIQMGSNDAFVPTVLPSATPPTGRAKTSPPSC